MTSAATRPPLARILATDAAIRAARFPNAVGMADELEVDPRTIQRDIEFMRDRLGAPLTFCRRRNGYAYEDGGFRLPFVHLSEGELLALFLAQQVLRQYRGTPWQQDLSRAFTRLAELLPETISLHLGAASEVFSATPAAVTPQNLGVFTRLLQAVRQGERLRIAYRTAARGEPKERIVDPYHIAAVGEDCYLIGRCHTRREVRMFATARVCRAEITGETFERPADFDPASYLAGSFRAVRGQAGQTYAVTLRFTPDFAGRLAEKLWHPTQQTEPQPDGSLLFRITVSDLTEVTRWVLSWGRECEVVGPEELRRRIHEEVRVISAQYRDYESA